LDHFDLQSAFYGVNLHCMHNITVINREPKKISNHYALNDNT